MKKETWGQVPGGQNRVKWRSVHWSLTSRADFTVETSSPGLGSEWPEMRRSPRNKGALNTLMASAIKI